MRKAARFVATLVIVGSFGVGLTALLSSPARAVDYPCDPIYQLLRDCKAQHGHWSNACCCCQLH
jgi:hypothetical protein